MTSQWQLFCVLLSSALLIMSSAPAAALEDADPNSPEVQDSAAFALESFNYFNKDPYLYKITTFESVKQMAVGGMRYEMDVLVKRSQCKKGEETGMDSCEFFTSPEDAKVFRCHFVVLNVPWKNQKVLIKSECTPVQK
nr:PREDICTED: cystatin-like [Lepisosteus oculatus]